MSKEAIIGAGAFAIGYSIFQVVVIGMSNFGGPIQYVVGALGTFLAILGVLYWLL